MNRQFVLLADRLPVPTLSVMLKPSDLSTEHSVLELCVTNLLRLMR
jgi:hypothetical protein